MSCFLHPFIIIIFLIQNATCLLTDLSFHLSPRVRREILRVVRMNGSWFSITTLSGLTWEFLSMHSPSWPLWGDPRPPGHQKWALCWCTAGGANTFLLLAPGFQHLKCAGWEDGGHWGPVFLETGVFLCKLGPAQPVRVCKIPVFSKYPEVTCYFWGQNKICS